MSDEDTLRARKGHGSEPSRSLDPQGRFVEIDTLKAAGILSVILIHALRAPWDPRVSSTEMALGAITRFAVPAFLFCSGFLYATTTPIDPRTILRRLRRVLVPYLTFSIAAQVWWFSQGQAHSPSGIVRDLLFGSSFGPYYYVFVHFFLVLFAPLFALLPRAALLVLTVLFLVAQGWLESRTGLILPIFWHIRDPLLWWGYFLLGWVIRLHYDDVRRFVTTWRGSLGGGLAVAVLACSWVAIMSEQSEWTRSAAWLDIHAILALLFVSTCDRKTAPRQIAALSDASFAIYLLHLFFIYAAETIVRPAAETFDLPVVVFYWSAGLFGSLGVIALSRRAFGPRSRDFIGA